MQRDPEQDYLRYPGRAKGFEDGEGDILVSLTWLGIALALVIVSIPLLDAIIQDPELRWAFLLFILTICACVLVLKTYPRNGFQLAPEIAQVSSKNEPGAAERELLTVTNALQGSPYSQMIAYLELRDMLVRRFMLLHHISRADAEARLADPHAARRLIKDDQLVWLLGYDFKGAYEPEQLKTRQGQMMVGDFNQVFPSLLRKLEGMR
jgi:hypothetical protein